LQTSNKSAVDFFIRISAEKNFQIVFFPWILGKTSNQNYLAITYRQNFSIDWLPKIKNSTFINSYFNLLGLCVPYGL
jgi:hypothetical protein